LTPCVSRIDKNDAVRYIEIVKARQAGARTVRRYENRKLYDPAGRRYVTLEDLARDVGAGQDIQVLDRKSGEDITNQVLAQVIFERIKERTASVPRQVLTRLIRIGTRRVSAVDWPGPQQLATRARDEAERIVARLIARGRLTLEEAVSLRQEIAQSAQRLAAEAQHGLETRLHQLLDQVDGDGIGPTLQALKERLLAFETYLAEPAAERAGRRRVPRRHKRRGDRP
jgi:polyhydroxyalkanoate synthesis repressor PhaR